MNVLVFDIETIPDVKSGRKLHKLDGLSEKEIIEALFALRRAKTGNDFLPHYMQKIVAISVVFASSKECKVWSLGDEGSDEATLIQRFYAGIERYKPTLVSWNGNGFDLPVLHYRSMLHNIQAKTYWEVGNHISEFRYNNYINRYHYRHVDVMDILAGYQARAFAPLDEFSSILGLPGKMGMSGSQVWEQYLAGEISAIRDYCETDVLNTYGVYLRFEHMRGNLDTNDYESRINQLQEYLKSQADRPHLQQFLEHWKTSALP